MKQSQKVYRQSSQKSEASSSQNQSSNYSRQSNSSVISSNSNESNDNEVELFCIDSSLEDINTKEVDRKIISNKDETIPIQNLFKQIDERKYQNNLMGSKAICNESHKKDQVNAQLYQQQLNYQKQNRDFVNLFECKETKDAILQKFKADQEFESDTSPSHNSQKDQDFSQNNSLNSDKTSENKSNQDKASKNSASPYSNEGSTSKNCSERENNINYHADSSAKNSLSHKNSYDEGNNSLEEYKVNNDNTNVSRQESNKSLNTPQKEEGEQLKIQQDEELEEQEQFFQQEKEEQEKYQQEQEEEQQDEQEQEEYKQQEYDEQQQEEYESQKQEEYEYQKSEQQEQQEYEYQQQEQQQEGQDQEQEQEEEEDEQYKQEEEEFEQEKNQKTVNLEQNLIQTTLKGNLMQEETLEKSEESIDSETIQKGTAYFSLQETAQQFQDKLYENNINIPNTTKQQQYNINQEEEISQRQSHYEYRQDYDQQIAPNQERDQEEVQATLDKQEDNIEEIGQIKQTQQEDNFESMETEKDELRKKMQSLLKQQQHLIQEINKKEERINLREITPTSQSQSSQQSFSQSPQMSFSQSKKSDYEINNHRINPHSEKKSEEPRESRRDSSQLIMKMRQFNSELQEEYSQASKELMKLKSQGKSSIAVDQKSDFECQNNEEKKSNFTEISKKSSSSAKKEKESSSFPEEDIKFEDEYLGLLEKLEQEKRKVKQLIEDKQKALINLQKQEQEFSLSSRQQQNSLPNSQSSSKVVLQQNSSQQENKSFQKTSTSPTSTSLKLQYERQLLFQQEQQQLQQSQSQQSSYSQQQQRSQSPFLSEKQLKEDQEIDELRYQLRVLSNKKQKQIPNQDFNEQEKCMVNQALQPQQSYPSPPELSFKKDRLLKQPLSHREFQKTLESDGKTKEQSRILSQIIPTQLKNQKNSQPSFQNQDKIINNNNQPLNFKKNNNLSNISNDLLEGKETNGKIINNQTLKNNNKQSTLKYSSESEGAQQKNILSNLRKELEEKFQLRLEEIQSSNHLRNISMQDKLDKIETENLILKNKLKQIEQKQLSSRPSQEEDKIMSSIQQELQVKSLQETFHKIKQLQQNRDQENKFIQCITNMVANCTNGQLKQSGTQNSKNDGGNCDSLSLKQVWKGLKLIMEDYLALKSQNNSQNKAWNPLYKSCLIENKNSLHPSQNQNLNQQHLQQQHSSNSIVPYSPPSTQMISADTSILTQIESILRIENKASILKSVQDLVNQNATMKQQLALHWQDQKITNKNNITPLERTFLTEQENKNNNMFSKRINTREINQNVPSLKQTQSIPSYRLKSEEFQVSSPHLSPQRIPYQLELNKLTNKSFSPTGIPVNYMQGLQTPNFIGQDRNYPLQNPFYHSLHQSGQVLNQRNFTNQNNSTSKSPLNYSNHNLSQIPLLNTQPNQKMLDSHQNYEPIRKFSYGQQQLQQQHLLPRNYPPSNQNDIFLQQNPYSSQKQKIPSSSSSNVTACTSPQRSRQIQRNIPSLNQQQQQFQQQQQILDNRARNSQSSIAQSPSPKHNMNVQYFSPNPYLQFGQI